MPKCVTCDKRIWPWQRRGQKRREITSTYSKPWHAPKCEPWWAKRPQEETWNGNDD